LTSDKTIPPGGEGEIKTTVNTHGRAGKLAKSVTVNTNDPEHPVVKLTIKANVIASINLEPSNLNFGEVEAGKAKTLKATVWLRDDLKATVTNVESNNEHVTAKLLPKPDEKGRRVIEVTVSKDAPPGPLHSVITVNTSAGDKQKARLTTRANVMGDLTFEPRALNLRAGTGKVVLSRRDANRPPLRVLDAHTTTPEFKVRMKEVEKQSRYEFEISVEPKGDIHRGALVIKTNNAKQPEIKIPLSYVKPRPRTVRAPGAPHAQKNKGAHQIELRPK